MEEILDLVEDILETNRQLIKWVHLLPEKDYEVYYPIVMETIEENIAKAENLLTELK